MQSLPDIDKVSEILSAVPGMSAKADSLNREVLVLSHDLDEYEEKRGICGDEDVDALIGMVSQLERWKNVERNMRVAEQEIANDLSNYDKLQTQLHEADIELPKLVSQLDKMVCPLCGRKGLHTEDA